MKLASENHPRPSGPRISFVPAADGVRPPPLHRPSPAPARQMHWKKILLIVGLSLLAALAFAALVGTLIFGGCMYLLRKAGH